MLQHRFPCRGRDLARWLSLAALATVLLPVSAAADSPSGGALVHGLSIQFGISAGSSVTAPVLTAAYGSLVSATYHFDPSNALRWGLSGSYSETTYDYVDNSQSGSATGSVSTTVDYLRYIDPEAPVKVYCGIGIAAGVSIAGWPVPVFSPPSQWDLAARTCLGVEWFFTSRLSLWAEYGASLGYAVGPPGTRGLSGSGTAISQTVVSFEPASVKVGLSAYLGR